MTAAGTKSKFLIFCMKVMVKVTRSLILVSLEKVLLVGYACKSYGKGLSIFATDRQINT